MTVNHMVSTSVDRHSIIHVQLLIISSLKSMFAIHIVSWGECIVATLLATHTGTDIVHEASWILYDLEPYEMEKKNGWIDCNLISKTKGSRRVINILASTTTVLSTSLRKTFFAWRFISNENIFVWLTISYQKPFVFSVSVFCSQICT